MVELEDILKCSICGKPFKQLDEHTYKADCKCISSKLRIAVG